MTMMTYEEAMDDVHTRFILNLPDDELRSAPRIFFQLEQAWWFYDDFICDGAAAAATTTTTKEEVLPRYKHVKPFSYAMFQFSPLLQPMLPNFDTMYDEFAKYKRSISTYGTILLNEEATKVALVRPWQSKSWTFPGGKVNQNESGYDAACRETYEETGFDPMVEPSVQPPPPPNSNSHSSSLTSSSSSLRTREEAYKLTYTERESNKKRTCYICRGVPLNFPFEPVARKEVSEIKWFDISTLPKQKTYAVLPFYNQLREWIRKDNKARGMIVDSSYNSSSRGSSSSSSRRGSGNNDDGDNNINDDGDNNDDGGLAPFFSNDGKAPWEQDEEGGDGDGEKKSTTEKNNSNSSSNNSVGSNPGPSARGQHKHEKQQHHQKQTQQRRDGSRGKPKSQNRRSTPPRAASASSSRGDSTGRGRRRGGGGGGGGESGEETTTCAKASPVVAVVVSASDPLVKSALATPGESRRWTEDEMFAANEKLSGRKITYDGNPHEFAAGGWGSGIVRNDKDVDGGAVVVDPHAFHIVGGAFMNSSSESAPSSLIAPPPEVSKLQPLVNARAMTPGSMAGRGGRRLQLTPFFSDDGRAPWEEHNARAPKEVTPLSGLVQGPPLERRNSKGLALLNRLRRGGSANNDDEVGEEGGGAGEFHVAMMADVKDTADFDDWFMTDKEITTKSQGKKLLMMSRVSNPTPVRGHESVPQAMSSPRDSQKVTGEDSPRIICPNEHLVWMQKWAQQLPQTGPTKLFGDFRLDVDSILNVAMTVVHKGPK